MGHLMLRTLAVWCEGCDKEAVFTWREPDACWKSARSQGWTLKPSFEQAPNKRGKGEAWCPACTVSNENKERTDAG